MVAVAIASCFAISGTDTSVPSASLNEPGAVSSNRLAHAPLNTIAFASTRRTSMSRLRAGNSSSIMPSV
jgi:hypothetical protein